MYWMVSQDLKIYEQEKMKETGTFFQFLEMAM